MTQAPLAIGSDVVRQLLALQRPRLRPGEHLTATAAQAEDGIAITLTRWFGTELTFQSRWNEARVVIADRALRHAQLGGRGALVGLLQEAIAYLLSIVRPPTLPKFRIRRRDPRRLRMEKPA